MQPNPLVALSLFIYYSPPRSALTPGDEKLLPSFFSFLFLAEICTIYAIPCAVLCVLCCAYTRTSVLEPDTLGETVSIIDRRRHYNVAVVFVSFLPSNESLPGSI